MSLKPPDLNNEFQGNIFYFQTYLVFSTILGSNHSYKTKADHLKGKTEKKQRKFIFQWHIRSQKFINRKNNKSQEMASLCYISAIARSLSQGHHCKLLGDSFAPGFYLSRKCTTVQ